MPGIGFREAALAVEQAETGDHRQLQPVRLLDREFEGRVEPGAVGLLQQVEDVAALAVRLHVIEHPNPLALYRHTDPHHDSPRPS